MSTFTVETFRGSLLTRHFVGHVLGRAFAGRLGEESMAAGRRRCGRWWRQVREQLGPASGVRAIWEVAAVPLFAQVGYGARLVRIEIRGVQAEARGDLVIARLEAGRGVAVVLVVAPWQERLDRVARVAMEAAVEAGQRWCVCFNGHQLRVVDVDRPYARRFVEFDLRAAIEEERGFALLWALLRPDALVGPVRRPAREPGRHGALIDQIVAACDAHGGSVREALQVGVRRALSSLAAALARAHRRGRRSASASSAASAADIVAQALTMIYRLLFLLFAEARALVPVWHPVYRDSYSIGALHAQAERHAVRGLWEAVQAVSRLAHEGCVTDDLAVTAFNGQLFSPEHTPLGEHLRIPSAIVADILDALMMTPAGNGRGRERITYADLGVEQLGTVYERVLDFAPSLEADIAHGGAGQPLAPQIAPTHTRKRIVSSARRKESGSFYTPRSMADYLVRATLAPLVAEASADDILSLRVLDPAMGSGAFLVSACRYLSWAHARARERDGAGVSAEARLEARLDARPAARAEARAEIRRHIARHCLFGVDLNPMAVQLARLSVWLTTMRRDAPLTFLDHHLRAGDSLVGASLDDLARKRFPRPRARGSSSALPLFAGDEPAQLMRAILPTRAALAAEDDSPATVREKERMLLALSREGALARWLRLADGWCASWFGADKSAAAWPTIADYLLHGHATFPAATLDNWLASIQETAARRRFFHWTLEFPEVFFDAEGQPLANGGFDAIVGNPPWDMIRNDARGETGEGDGRETRALSRFVREAGIYRCAGDAHFNCYQLFVERSLALLKRGGRLGLVLPWGLAADHGSARLRRQLLESCDLDTLVSFENSRAIFPIHRSTRFVLLTATTGRATTSVRCRFGQRDPAVLDTPDDAAGAGRAIAMSVDLLRRVSGEGLAFPDARSADDIALLERLHTAHPALSSPDGWHVKFGRELNVTDDRGLIEPIRTDDEVGVRVIDGKHLHPFTIAADAITHVVRGDALGALQRRLPDMARPRLAFRDIASPTNRLTLIAALLPADTVSTHTLSVLKSPLAPDAQWCLCALLNSFVANYLVRLRVSTHVTLALMDRLPVPRPLDGSTLFRDLADFARRLSADPSGATSSSAASGHALESSVENLRGALGRAPAARPARSGARRAAPSLAYARLQALAAQAYGLRAAEFEYVLGTFPLIGGDVKTAARRYFVPGTGAAAM